MFRHLHFRFAWNRNNYRSINLLQNIRNRAFHWLGGWGGHYCWKKSSFYGDWASTFLRTPWDRRGIATIVWQGFKNLFNYGSWQFTDNKWFDSYPCALIWYPCLPHTCLILFIWYMRYSTHMVNKNYHTRVWYKIRRQNYFSLLRFQQYADVQRKNSLCSIDARVCVLTHISMQIWLHTRAYL